MTNSTYLHKFVSVQMVFCSTLKQTSCQLVCICNSGEIMLISDYDPCVICMESKGELGVLHLVNINFIDMC